MQQNPQPILLIEDNPDDVFLMRRAAKRSGVPWNMQVVTTGREALDYFNGAGKFADRGQFPLPSLVFLDLKLPYVSGFDVLAAVREKSEFKDLPIVILTSSPEERDQQRSMSLGAKAYLIKPPTEPVLQKIAQGDWAGIGATRSNLELQ